MTAKPTRTDATLDTVTADASPGGTPSRTMEKTRARVDELRPHPRNPRKITAARLEQLQRTLAASTLSAAPDRPLIACEQIGRRVFLMEIDPGYCDVIRQRYADYTGRPELAP